MDRNTMQVLGLEDGRRVDPWSLVIAGAVPPALEDGEASFPIEIRDLAAEVWLGHDEKAPPLPVTARLRLLLQLDALEQHLTRDGTIEVQATATSPGGGQDVVD
jgi:hypothetical protein